ncbi:MAG: response regulator transcription factor [Eubacteriales bacterium]|nr:response regulator transcription factor [Eubacteriales bacterium]
MALIWTVEDDESIASLIVNIIKRTGHKPEHFWDGIELEKRLKKDGLPDLLLLDIMLRSTNGFDILKQWKQQPQTRHVPIIIISAKSSENDKVRGLSLGAEDYITKPFGLREFKARIDTALRRVTPAALEIKLDALQILPDERKVYADGQEIQLTQQEFELLLYLAKNAGHVLTRQKLLKEVWGYDGGADSTRTLDYHIRSLRKKLKDDAQNPRFIKTVHGSGYSLIKND